MLTSIASIIMPRTTLNIDGPVLEDLKRIAARERKPLGRLASDLLAEATSRQAARRRAAPRRLDWVSRPLGAKVDLADTDAILAALDEAPPARRRRAR